MMPKKLKWVPERKKLRYLTEKNLRTLLMRAYKRVKAVCQEEDKPTDDFEMIFMSGAGAMIHLVVEELKKLEKESVSDE